MGDYRSDPRRHRGSKIVNNKDCRAPRVNDDVVVSAVGKGENTSDIELGGVHYYREEERVGGNGHFEREARRPERTERSGEVSWSRWWLGSSQTSSCTGKLDPPSSNVCPGLYLVVSISNFDNSSKPSFASPVNRRRQLGIVTPA